MLELHEVNIIGRAQASHQQNRTRYFSFREVATGLQPTSFINEVENKRLYKELSKY